MINISGHEPPTMHEYERLVVYISIQPNNNNNNNDICDGRLMVYISIHHVVTVVTNPTTTFVSSSTSSLSDPDSLSKSSQVAIKLCLICFLNLFDLKVDFLDFSFDFSF